jgi:hypothetical protein
MADKARCLGVSLVSDALGVALDEAARLGEKAIHALGPTGADDMTDRDRARLAAEADEALDRLGTLIAAAKATDQ